MRAALLGFAVLATTAIIAPGCTTTEEDLCDVRCDCVGCSDRDYNNCLGDYDRDARAAESLGCPDLYEELIVCQEDTYVCRGTDFDTRCGAERDRLNNCLNG